MSEAFLNLLKLSKRLLSPADGPFVFLLKGVSVQQGFWRCFDTPSLHLSGTVTVRCSGLNQPAQRKLDKTKDFLTLMRSLKTFGPHFSSKHFNDIFQTGMEHQFSCLESLDLGLTQLEHNLKRGWQLCCHARQRHVFLLLCLGLIFSRNPNR